MKNAKLKEQITSAIALKYDRELWSRWPGKSYEESIQPIVDELIRIATCHKRGWSYQSYKYNELDLYAPTDSDVHIGERIKELRLRKGWSLAKVAKKAGVDAEYLRNVERGEPILGMWALESILDALKVKSSAVLPF